MTEERGLRTGDIEKIIPEYSTLLEFDKETLDQNFEENYAAMKEATVRCIMEKINAKMKEWTTNAGDILTLELPKRTGWEVLLVMGYTEASPRTVQIDSSVSKDAIQAVIETLTSEGFFTKLSDDDLKVSLKEFPAEETE